MADRHDDGLAAKGRAKAVQCRGVERVRQPPFDRRLARDGKQSAAEEINEPLGDNLAAILANDMNGRSVDAWGKGQENSLAAR